VVLRFVRNPQRFKQKNAVAGAVAALLAVAAPISNDMASYVLIRQRGPAAQLLLQPLCLAQVPACSKKTGNAHGLFHLF
jgi:hypothetical protein